MMNKYNFVKFNLRFEIQRQKYSLEKKKKRTINEYQILLV